MIVSTPGTLGGRWRIDGHRIDVMMLRTNPRDWLIKNYTHVPITNEMIDEALAWDFPPIREAYPFTEELDVECACGESANLVYHEATADPVNVDSSAGTFGFTCPACHKKWRLTITLEPA